MNRNLTVKYCAHQFMYWAAVGGVVSFAATYLLSLGFTAAQVGGILFSALLLSFLLQPFVGSFADKAERNILPVMIVGLSAVCTVCFLAVRFIDLPQWFFAVIYVIGVMALDMQVPLMNSLSVYYTKRGWTINYGLGRGVGGFGFAVATLGYGYLMEYFGENQMPVAAVMFIVLSAVITLFYPHGTEEEAAAEEGNHSVPCTIPEFFSKYRWYCISLFGVLFLGVFHVMTENYLIEIFKRIGGGQLQCRGGAVCCHGNGTSGDDAVPAVSEKIRMPKASYDISDLLYDKVRTADAGKLRDGHLSCSAYAVRQLCPHVHVPAVLCGGMYIRFGYDQRPVHDHGVLYSRMRRR